MTPIIDENMRQMCIRHVFIYSYETNSFIDSIIFFWLQFLYLSNTNIYSNKRSASWEIWVLIKKDLYPMKYHMVQNMYELIEWHINELIRTFYTCEYPVRERKGETSITDTARYRQFR